MGNSKEILLMQEVERRRIAEELHDTTVQDMVHLSQQIELALLNLDSDLVQAKLELLSSKRQIKSIINGIRETIYNLRPMVFDDMGWGAAFDKLYDSLVESGLDVKFDIDNISTADGVTAISIYRVVCEACNNVIKHSYATRVSVSIKCVDSFIKIFITDNGVGFDNKKKLNHFGFQLMKERVDLLLGNMDVISDNSGTSIKINIPV